MLLLRSTIWAIGSFLRTKAKFTFHWKHLWAVPKVSKRPVKEVPTLNVRQEKLDTGENPSISLPSHHVLNFCLELTR